jgi:hypothetical protein
MITATEELRIEKYANRLFEDNILSFVVWTRKKGLSYSESVGKWYDTVKLRYYANEAVVRRYLNDCETVTDATKNTKEPKVLRSTG